MTEAPQRPALPDHLSTDPRSPHHVPAVFEHPIGIRFNDLPVTPDRVFEAIEKHRRAAEKKGGGK